MARVSSSGSATAPSSRRRPTGRRPTSGSRVAPRTASWASVTRSRPRCRTSSDRCRTVGPSEWRQAADDGQAEMASWPATDSAAVGDAQVSIHRHDSGPGRALCLSVGGSTPRCELSLDDVDPAVASVLVDGTWWLIGRGPAERPEATVVPDRGATEVTGSSPGRLVVVHRAAAARRHDGHVLDRRRPRDERLVPPPAHLTAEDRPRAPCRVAGLCRTPFPRWTAPRPSSSSSPPTGPRWASIRPSATRPRWRRAWARSSSPSTPCGRRRRSTTSSSWPCTTTTTA